MITYTTIILVSWVSFFLVWGVSALFVKPDVRSGGAAALWQRYWLLRLFAAVLIVILARRSGSSGAVFVFNVIYTTSPTLGWAGAAVTAIGIGFAMWARLTLGRNWSPRPAAKEQHEFVMRGPYAYVRHPIYSGIMLAALGTALLGSILGIVVFVVTTITLAWRMDKEERIMLELFPGQYPAYQQRTKRLVPFVW
jgi:protein-S-isoprenylcysteine O-methyltransferase Ste14